MSRTPIWMEDMGVGKYKPTQLAREKARFSSTTSQTSGSTVYRSHDSSAARMERDGVLESADSPDGGRN